ncbi:hypothetical protein A2W24_02465 [Microgenomates group bacterium RBG_16_45_19]|nr:MAG: hypothetical protein A2W24_02465 [Microgenomates group bacterium RBG_16_45_19]
MLNHMTGQRLIWWGIGLALAAVSLVVFEWPTDDFKLIACDVGQGDATLITQGFNQVLVDGGPSANKLLACLGQTMPFWDKRIELVVATHPELDHIAGLVPVLKRYQIETVLVSDAGKETEIFNQFLEGVRQSRADLLIADRGMELALGEIKLTVLAPQKDEAILAQWYQNPAYMDQTVLGAKQTGGRNEVNQRSVVLWVAFREIEALLTGDISLNEEKELVKVGLSQAEILKVAHHGSKTSTSEELLAAIEPKIAIVEVGEKNTYGHPQATVLDRLKAHGSLIWRTDLNGQITVSSDGRQLTIESQKND